MLYETLGCPWLMTYLTGVGGPRFFVGNVAVLRQLKPTRMTSARSRPVLSRTNGLEGAASSEGCESSPAQGTTRTA